MTKQRIARTILRAVLAAALMTTLPLGHVAAQEGWRVQTNSDGFEKPSTSLVVSSADRRALLDLYCRETPMKRGDSSWVEYLPEIGLTLDRRLGFFNFVGGNYYVFGRARFLPDSEIVTTDWESLAASGHANVIIAEHVRDYPNYFVDDGKATVEGLLNKLRRADTLQAQFELYGKGSITLRFAIRNHDTLEHFLTKCTVGPEQRP